MPATDADVIDALVGIAQGSDLDAIRARRPEARTHAQATYRALGMHETHYRIFEETTRKRG